MQNEFPPTAEQSLILEAARGTPTNLLINALAGAAKTSTLVRLGRALASTPILCLAFNKKIAIEMKERLTSNCQAKTLNGLGHQVWMQTIGKRPTLSDSKMYDIMKDLIEALPAAQKTEAYDYFSDTLKAAQSAKTAGYVPYHFPHAARLMDEEDLHAWLDDEPTDLQMQLIIEASRISVEQGMKGVIDFNDQILLPTVFPARFPQFPLVMVDEAQDLSALNHATLRKLVSKRIFAVGDACQAIYGFRGAHEDSMSKLRETFSMDELTLSISFRCPQNVVKAAQWRAPHMRSAEGAPEGEVRTLTSWTVESIPHNAAVLCRNNAPIFRCALEFIKAGRYPQIMGADIGKSLVKTMKKFGPGTMPQDEVIAAIEKWRTSKLATSRSPGSIADQAECMLIFAEQGPTLSAALAYAEHLFNSDGPIKMMTIHKSKGLEFNDVFILNRSLIQQGKGQEDNLLYVAQTRAKRSLTYIEMEGYGA